MTPNLLQGDCFEVLQTLEAESVDSCVCDPPYSLGFMGKTWDKHDSPLQFQQWCEKWAKEVYRVLKPGAHLIAFGGTRTYHRLACGVEDAGFECRDSVHWVYGSGFPKSLNISKAIDKAAGAERETTGTASGMGKQNPEWNGTAQGRAENSFKPKYDITAPATDAAKQWDGWGTALKPAHEIAVLARKPFPGRTVAQNVLEHGTGGLNIDATRVPTSQGDVRSNLDNSSVCTSCGREVSPISHNEHNPAPAQAGSRPGADTSPRANESECAQQNQSPQDSQDDCRPARHFDGEPSPLSGEDDREGETPRRGGHTPRDHQSSIEHTHGDLSTTCLHCTAPHVESKARWPSNIIHDGSDEVLAEFAKYGESKSGQPRNDRGTGGIWSGSSGVPCGPQHGDTGTAARFFYAAKSSKDDRNDGLDSLETVYVECDAWEGGDQKAKLRVDTAQSPPRVIDVSGAPIKSVSSWNTLLFGSLTTDPFLRDISSIIETATNSTMRSPTLNWLRRSHTSGSTVDANGEEWNGGSPVESVESSTPCLTITSVWMVSARGVDRAPSRVQYKISANANSADHPTVKPTSLMRYLVRLVTPKGGLVLDPFAGSGTTLIAAYREDCRSIGIELDPDYFKMAEHRIDRATSQLRLDL